MVFWYISYTICYKGSKEVNVVAGKCSYVD